MGLKSPSILSFPRDSTLSKEKSAFFGVIQFAKTLCLIRIREKAIGFPTEFIVTILTIIRVKTKAKGDKMKKYFKQIKRLKIFCWNSLFLLLLTGHVNASECGVLQLQNNRSSGISVINNKCTESSDISIGTVFELSGKGRLWLKSIPSEFMRSAFQMICLNRTGNLLQLEFSDMLSPWLSQAKLNNCSGWIDNKLSCDGSMGKKKGLYCVLSFVQPLTGSQSKQIERTTSVKMRDIKKIIQIKGSFGTLDKQQMIAVIEPELRLCKKLYQATQGIKATWSVVAAEVTEISVNLTGDTNNHVLSECVETVIKSFSFPGVSEKVVFNSAF